MDILARHTLVMKYATIHTRTHGQKKEPRKCKYKKIFLAEIRNV